jgi:hypothetical protein
MAHFDWGNAATSGDWSAVTGIDLSWMTTIDQNQQKAINGDEGGTWAPSSVITIGGDGLTVSGAFTATNIIDSAVEGQFDFNPGSTLNFYDQAYVKSTGDLTFESGSTLVLGAGTGMVVNAASAIACAGALALSSYPTITSKTVYKRALRLLATTQVDGTSPDATSGSQDAAAAFHATRLYSGTSYPSVLARKMSGSQSRFWLALPQPIQGATLEEIQIWTGGIGTTPDLSFPSYIVRRYALASGGSWPPATIVSCGLLQNDAHQAAATWSNDMRITTLPCTLNNTIDVENYTYAIECTTPNSSSASTAMNVFEVMAKYTVTDLRP